MVASLHGVFLALLARQLLVDYRAFHGDGPARSGVPTSVSWAVVMTWARQQAALDVNVRVWLDMMLGLGASEGFLVGGRCQVCEA